MAGALESDDAEPCGLCHSVRAGRLSVEQERELWDRWKRDETLVEIGRALGRSTRKVFTLLNADGGIAPRTRKRRQNSLRLEEREEISRGLVAGLSLRAIAESSDATCRSSAAK